MKTLKIKKNIKMFLQHYYGRKCLRYINIRYR